MKIAVPKETKPFERRVALTPDVVKSLQKAGFTCLIETGAGTNSYFSDEAYQQAGAGITADAAATYAAADVVLRVNAPTEADSTSHRSSGL